MGSLGTCRRLLLTLSLSLHAEASREENFYGWRHAFQAGRDVTNGTEMVVMETHEGMLFGGVGYWMYPTHRALEIVRLDSPSGQWVVDGRPSLWASRPETLKQITWTTDGAGALLPAPVTRLITTYYMDYLGEGRCYIAARDAANYRWLEMVYYRERPFRSRYFSARTLAMHRDAVTGVDHLFVTTGMPGIIRGSYDSQSLTSVSFDPSTESGNFPTRALGLVVVGGRLYASGGSFIRRRNDGLSATWSVVFNMAEHDSSTVDEAVGGIRGLSMIPNPVAGESLYFSWCPNSQSRGCMIRVDVNVDEDTYTHHQEACVPDEAREVLGQDTLIVYTIANYNTATPVPTSGGLVHLIGYQILLYWRSVDRHPTTLQQRTIGGGRKLAYYAGAGYLIRRGPRDYEARVPGGPRFCPWEVSPALVAVRSIANSPFGGDGSIFMGGYDCNHYRSSNNAWILHGSAAAAYQSPVLYGSRACTTTTTITVTSTTTTTTLSCPLCGLRARREHWIDLRYASAEHSVGSIADPHHAIDGNSDTWGGAENFVLDLGMAHYVSAVQADLKDCLCSKSNSLVVQGSLDGSTWEVLRRHSVHASGGHINVNFNVNFTARFLLFHVSSVFVMHQSHQVSFWELAVYGFEEHWTSPQVLLSDRVYPGSTYTCGEAQLYFNFGNPPTEWPCLRGQRHFGEDCCNASTPPERAPAPVSWPLQLPSVPTLLPRPDDNSSSTTATTSTSATTTTTTTHTVTITRTLSSSSSSSSSTSTSTSTSARSSSTSTQTSTSSLSTTTAILTTLVDLRTSTTQWDTVRPAMLEEWPDNRLTRSTSSTPTTTTTAIVDTTAMARPSPTARAVVAERSPSSSPSSHTYLPRTAALWPVQQVTGLLDLMVLHPRAFVQLGPVRTLLVTFLAGLAHVLRDQVDILSVDSLRSAGRRLQPQEGVPALVRVTFTVHVPASSTRAAIETKLQEADPEAESRRLQQIMQHSGLVEDFSPVLLRLSVEEAAPGVSTMPSATSGLGATLGFTAATLAVGCLAVLVFKLRKRSGPGLALPIPNSSQEAVGPKLLHVGLGAIAGIVGTLATLLFSAGHASCLSLRGHDEGGEGEDASPSLWPDPSPITPSLLREASVEFAFDISPRTPNAGLSFCEPARGKLRSAGTNKLPRKPADGNKWFGLANTSFRRLSAAMRKRTPPKRPED